MKLTIRQLSQLYIDARLVEKFVEKKGNILDPEDTVAVNAARSITKLARELMETPIRVSQ